MAAGLACIRTSVLLTSVVIVISLTLVRPVAARIYCYACNSYLGQCGDRVDNSKGTVFRSRCSGPCFARRGEDDAIYRGCTDGFSDVPSIEYSYVGCRNQTWNNRSLRWCICNWTLCNGDSLEAMSRRRPPSSTSRLLLTSKRLPPYRRTKDKRQLDETDEKEEQSEKEVSSDDAKTGFYQPWSSEPIYPTGPYLWYPNNKPPHIVEKEYERRDSFDLTTIPLKADDRTLKRSYYRNYDAILTNDIHDHRQLDERFHGQRENFANLYISRPPTDNDDVIYDDVPRDNERTPANAAVNNYRQYSPDSTEVQATGPVRQATSYHQQRRPVYSFVRENQSHKPYADKYHDKPEVHSQSARYVDQHQPEIQSQRPYVGENEMEGQIQRQANVVHYRPESQSQRRYIDHYHDKPADYANDVRSIPVNDDEQWFNQRAIDIHQTNNDMPGQRSGSVPRSSHNCDETQPRYRRHPSSSDCQLYIACVTGPDGRYVPVVMRCLLGLQWDDEVKMCVTHSHTCRHDDHVTADHAHVTPDHAQFDVSWLPADSVYHRRQPMILADQQRRHLNDIFH